MEINESMGNENFEMFFWGQLKKAIAALFCLRKQRRGDFVFVTRDGHSYREGGFLKPLQKAAKRAGIEKRVDIGLPGG